MTEEHYPRVGQVVTVIAVRNLQAAVLGATVSESQEGRYALRVEETERLTAGPVVAGGRVKLLYGSGPMVWRLSGVIEAVKVEDGALSLQCAGPPRPGERREFIRAEMVLTLFARKLATRDLEEAAALAQASPPGADDARWKPLLVDLSGSGIRLRLDEPAETDDLIEVRLKLDARPKRPLVLFGRVVRVTRAEGDVLEAALRFEGLTEAQQDALINQAFRVRYEQLGA